GLAERALVAADARLHGVRWQIHVAAFTVGSQGEHRGSNTSTVLGLPRRGRDAHLDAAIASGRAARHVHEGGAENSRTMPSGSRNDTPEPYVASLMRPRVMPSSSRRRSHVSSSSRSAQPKLAWSRPTRNSLPCSGGAAVPYWCSPRSVPFPSRYTVWC